MHSVSSLSALFDRCLALDSLSSALSIHAHLVKTGLYSHTFLGNRLLNLYGSFSANILALRTFDDILVKNIFSWNILLTAYWRAGSMEAACRLFVEMPEKDSVSWNLMFSGFASITSKAEAFDILRGMQDYGVRPSAFTLSTAASWVSSARHSKQIHGLVIRSSLALSNTILSNSIIAMYGRVDLKDYAFRVFDSMEEPDIISWNSMILLHRDRKHWNEVFKYFHLMKNSKIGVDEFSVSTILNICADIKDPTMGEQLLAHCKKMGFLSNSIVCSAVIDMYSKCGRLDDAVRLFHDMKRWDSALCNSMISCYGGNSQFHEALGLFLATLRNGVRPTQFTFASILSSSSCYGLMDQGTQIHCLICKLGFEDDMIIQNALVDVYAKLGIIETATKIFSLMIVKDLVSWNTMIMGLAQNGKGKEALKCFTEMQEMCQKPDRITLIGILSACCHDGLVHEGKRIFLSMEKKFGIKRGLEHYAYMVDMLGQAGRLKEAMEVVNTMPHKPTASLWGLLLEAAKNHGNLKLAELAAEKIIELEPRCPIPYFLLARMHETRGRWDSMARVWKIMKEKDVKRTSGSSWICIRNFIYTFKSDQILLYEGEAINAILCLLSWQVEVEEY